MKGKVIFIGAGPGDPDLITVKGRNVIEKADVIIYAGSLVNKDVLSPAKEDCEIHNSAYLNLDETDAIITEAVNDGKLVARVHTGDPSIYGAIAEQIRELSENTRRETEQISAILEELTRNADQTVEAVEKSVEVSNEQDRMITGVADQFDEMNRNVNELVVDISDIDNMIESLSTANNQIVDNIVQLSATTEEVTAAAQQSTEITERNYSDSVEAQKLLHGVLEVSRQMDKYF